jgi:hypothetical protein
LITLKTSLRPFLFIFLFSLSQVSSAQTDNKIIRCGTVDYYKQLFQSNASLRSQYEANQRNFSIRNISPGALRILDFNDTITLAIHVIGSATMQSQVTNAIIQSQVDVLNEDYQGKNADSVRIPAAFKPLYGKSKLTFALAGTNQFGEPTSGITRITSGNTFTLATLDDAKFTATGGDDAWDPTKYLNIWIVNFGSSNVLGSSVFPGDPRALKYHGFVCDYRAFGRDAPYLFSQYTKGRTTTHELGHFFNLQHTWGDDGGACSGTDFPNDAANDDTPNQANNTNGNPDPSGIGIVITDNCSPTAPGVMYQNFMDYTDDVGMALFTKGQQVRMENTLTNATDRIPLLASTAYQAAPVFTNDAGIRQIISPVTTACNNFKPVVILRNSGSSPLTSVKIITVLNNGTPVVFNWTGNLASYTETNFTLPSFSAGTGNVSLSIYTSAPNNAIDGRATNDTAKRIFEVIGITPLNASFAENFSGAQFPPSQWGINNPDGDETWKRNEGVGKNAPGSAWFNDYNNATYHRFDDLVTPNFSYTDADSILLYFNLASAIYTVAGPGVDTDTLTVLVTKDCGNSFTTVYKKWGDSLQTVGAGATVASDFLPTAAQWRRDTVNIGRALGISEPGFQVYFRMSGNFENNLFIDDVSIIKKEIPDAVKEKGYRIAPTLFSGQFSIFHYKPATPLKSIAVYNIAGQMIWASQYNGNAGNNITVNLQGLAAGMYFVRMKYSDGRSDVVEKIVKQ